VLTENARLFGFIREYRCTRVITDTDHKVDQKSSLCDSASAAPQSAPQATGSAIPHCPGHAPRNREYWLEDIHHLRHSPHLLGPVIYCFCPETKGSEDEPVAEKFSQINSPNCPALSKMKCLSGMRVSMPREGSLLLGQSRDRHAGSVVIFVIILAFMCKSF